MTQASGRMTSECANTPGNAKPVTIVTAVRKWPRSMAPDDSYSAESASGAQWAKTALGSGASTKVRAVQFHRDKSTFENASSNLKVVLTN